MASYNLSPAGKVTHDNYATSTAPATKTLPSNCVGIYIANMDVTNNLLVSFVAGVTFKTIGTSNYLSLSVDGRGAGRFTSYVIKSSAGTPNAECLYSSEL